MPRLRRIKDYEIDFDCGSGQESSDETDASQGDVAGNEIVEQPASTKGWWSNEAVIATLSDQKLHTAVEYHRTMVRLLESEIRHRALASATPRRSQPNIVSRGSRFVTADPQIIDPRRRAAARRSRSTTPTTKGGLKLSPEQMLKALQLLIKTKENK